MYEMPVTPGRTHTPAGLTRRPAEAGHGGSQGKLCRVKGCSGSAHRSLARGKHACAGARRRKEPELVNMGRHKLRCKGTETS